MSHLLHWRLQKKMIKNKKIAVLIAYRAEKTLKKFWDKFPQEYFDEVILVDDASMDNTFEVAKKLSGLSSFRNEKNMGYGGNLMVCFSKALKKGADIIFEIHPDGEYEYSLETIKSATKKIEQGADLVLGNRFAKGFNPLSNGMRVWKYYPTRILTSISNIVLGTNLADLHQGFRVYSKSLLKEVEFKKNSSGYLFSFEIIVQAKRKNFKIEQIPVSVNYSGKKRGASLKNSLHYSFGVFNTLFIYSIDNFKNKNKLFNR